MKKPFWLLSFFGMILLLVSCTEDDVDIATELELSPSQLEAISYFKEVALGFENGNSSEITRKWGAAMNVFVGGNPSSANTLTLQQAVTDINQLATDGFSIEIVNDSLLANCYLFFGSGLDFADIFPEEENNVNANTTGFFSVWWNNNILNEARIVINPNLLSPTQQRSVILEEITQSTGLTNDSPLQPNSIFYETADNPGYTPEYADIDRELIRLLYHPKMTVGLDENQVDGVLRDILSNE